MEGWNEKLASGESADNLSGRAHVCPAHSVRSAGYSVCRTDTSFVLEALLQFPPNLTRRFWHLQTRRLR